MDTYLSGGGNEFLAKLIPLLFLILAFYQCLRSFRENRYRKSSIALAIVLIAWLLAVLLSLLSQYASIPGTESAAFTFVTLLLVLVGLFVGVNSLVDLSNPIYRRQTGKKEASWAIINSVLLLVVVFPNMYGSITRISQPESLPEVRKIPFVTPAKSVSNSPQIYDAPDLNFRITIPQKPWTMIDAKKIAPEASVAFIRTRPAMYCMIIGENTGSSIDLIALTELAKAYLRSSADWSSVLEEKAYRLKNREGVRIVTEARVQGQDVTYVHWLHVADRYAYQLIAWTERSTPKEWLLQEFDSAFSGFQTGTGSPLQLQTATTETLPDANVRYSKFGYSLRAHEPWEFSPDPEYDKVHIGIDAVYFILPVYLMGFEPSHEIFARAIMKADGLDSETVDAFAEYFEYSESSASLQSEFRSGEMIYEDRFILKNGFAYWVGLRYAREIRVENRILNQAHSLIAFKQSPPTINTQAFSEREKTFHSQVFNQMGELFYNKGKFPESLQYLKTAFDLKQDQLILDSICRVYLATRQPEEALQWLEKYQKFFPDSQALKQRRDEVKKRLEKTKSN